MLLDYSLIAEVFIYYLQNGVPIIYAIVAVAVFDFYYLYTHNLEQKQRILHKFGMSLIVSVAIGFYEAAANVFLTGMLLIMIVDCFGANRMQIRKFKQFFMSLFLIGRILVYAILERSLITRACMAVFGIEPYSYRSAGSMLRILKYPGRILTIIRQILRDYVFVGLAYYPIGLFVAASILFVIIILAAAVKKRNSRSVRFEDLPFEEALAKAEEAEQPVCIYFTADRCQACLLLEKNVLNLDEVADYYNDHFVNLRVNTSRTQELARRYGIKQCPAFLFLNAKGKVIYQDEGAETKEQLLDNAALALKKAGGISFQELSDEEARAKAQQENKPVFIDYYIPGGAHKEMLRTVFADPEVAALFEQQFVNVARESGQAVLVFTDAGGNELHRVRNIMSPEDLLQEARMVLEGKGLAGMEKEFRQGSRRPEFLKSYMAMLGRADRYREAGEIAALYLRIVSGKLNIGIFSTAIICLPIQTFFNMY